MAAWLHLGHLPDSFKETCAARRNLVALVNDLDQLVLRDAGLLVGLIKPEPSLLT
jgi:hypothetical protein